MTRDLAGEVGIEPTKAGIKTQCLTTWRLPNNLQQPLTTYYSYVGKQSPYSSTKSCNGCFAKPCATTPRIPCGNCFIIASAWLRLANSANTHAPDPVIIALPNLLRLAI